ncbi:spermidine synthase [Advenella kashmirensis W13003]|uniref:Spermidine synthase n=1 Tax=Advenella kashmirensis W13003 TaxID=1424334 RepID=V8QSS8_9BURK|nr:spermidine synthase [Advenella kashmirensis]ETF02034.1 spermidine synthase [Advenella kashmirensis W13003]
MSQRRREPHPDFDDPIISESEGVRYLHFNSEWIQGAMRVSRPEKLEFEYTQQMMAWLLFLAPPIDRDIGILGLGAGSLTRFCQHHFDSNIVTVEWNPQVTSLCESAFALRQTDRSQVVHQDAHDWVQEPYNDNRYGVLMVDLYDYTAQGPVCSSAEFYRGCRQVCRDIGVVTINLFGHHGSFRKNIRHIGSAFDDRMILFPETIDGNRIVIAFTGPPLRVARQALQQRAHQVQSLYRLPATGWLKTLLRENGRTGDVLEF